MSFRTAIVVFPVLLSVAGAVNNGLARTPQMGWDNWNAFGCDVSEDLLLGTAQKIVDYGLKDVGYHYVVLDDCWSTGRSSNGTLIPDSTKFPNGMADVAAKIHALGLGFGMYSSAGKYTCGRYAGSINYEEVDAQTFASWGVDYLKYDNCYNEGESGTPKLSYDRYKRMGDALNATGRPILYGMCNWGEDGPWNWAQTIANSWRMSGDITDSFDKPDPRCPCTGDEGYTCLLPGFHCSMMNILNKVSGFPQKGEPGAWNDLDMLEIGNGGMSDTEYITHMTLWSALKSPLIMGTDIRKLSAESLSIYTNPAILALSQDPDSSAVVRRWRYFDPEEFQMYSGGLGNDDFVVILLNAGSKSKKMNATLEDVFVDYGGSRSEQAQSSWDLFDLWGNRMPDRVANYVLYGNGTVSEEDVNKYYYNATELSYEEGLTKNDTRLMGTWTGRVQAGGKIEVEVESHGVKAYRMRMRGSRKRDEL